MFSVRLGYHAGVGLLVQVLSWLPAMRITRLLAVGLAAVACASTRPKFEVSDPEHSAQKHDCQRGNLRQCAQLGQYWIANARTDDDISHGVVLLEVACGGRVAEACAKLGAIYARGPNVERSPARARELLGRACQERVGPACTSLGELLSVGAPGNQRETVEAFRKACRLKDAAGCERLGMQEWGDAFSGNRESAMAAFTAACNLGRRSSCHVLGVVKLRERSETEAGVRILHENCFGGHVESCLELAELWAPELTAVPSCEQSLIYAEKACTGQRAEGCAIVAICTLAARGDDVRSLALLEAACAKNDPLSCFYWATTQRTKIAAITDRRRLRAAYSVACSSKTSGIETACVRLAIMDLEDSEGDVAEEKPLEFLRSACMRGIGEACCALSAEYRVGKRIEGDQRRAEELATKACSLRFTACCPTPP